LLLFHADGQARTDLGLAHLAKAMLRVERSVPGHGGEGCERHSRQSKAGGTALHGIEERGANSLAAMRRKDAHLGYVQTVVKSFSHQEPDNLMRIGDGNPEGLFG
jgi:hypothetical protein